MYNGSNEVSFVDHLRLRFPQEKCVQSTAIALGDVDNDKEFELVVGGTGGELAIYKGCKLNPWRVCCNLGTINCIGIADVRGNGTNSLVVVSGEGFLYLFDIAADGAEPTTDEKGAKLFARSVGQDFQRSDDIRAHQSVPSSSNIKPPFRSVQHTPDETPIIGQPTRTPMSALSTSGNARDDIAVRNAGKSVDHPREDTVRTHRAKSTGNISEKKQAQPTKSGMPSKYWKSLPWHKVWLELSQEKAHTWKTKILNPSWYHRCVHNCTALLLEDIDNDGIPEIIMGTSGRDVYIYKLVEIPTRSSAPTNPSSSTPTSTSTPAKTPLRVIKCLEYQKKWKVPKKVTSLALYKNSWGRSMLFVGQDYHKGYSIIDFNDNIIEKELLFEISSPSAGRRNSKSHTSENSENTQNFDKHQEQNWNHVDENTEKLPDDQVTPTKNLTSDQTDIVYEGIPLHSQELKKKVTNSFPLYLFQIRRPRVNHHLNPQTTHLIGITTLQGQIAILESETKMLWNTKIEKPILAAKQTDILHPPHLAKGEFNQELSVCCWDGTTYIFNQSGQSVKFNFGEEVSAFSSGLLSVLPNKEPVPCLVFVNFHDEICVFFNLKTTPLTHSFRKPKKQHHHHHHTEMAQGNNHPEISHAKSKEEMSQHVDLNSMSLAELLALQNSLQKQVKS